MEKLLKFFGIRKLISGSRGIVAYSSPNFKWVLKIYLRYGFGILNVDDHRGISVYKQKRFDFRFLSFRYGYVNMFGYNISWLF